MADDMPLVLAIVSTYKAGRFIEGCLEDLLSQSIADQLEIVVVDSASPQNEGDIVKRFQKDHPNIKYIRTPERETVYAAWNRGIQAASGKYITNANTDDRHRKDAFEVLSAELDSNPDVALVYANVHITTEENRTWGEVDEDRAFRWHDFSRRKLVQGCFVGPQPMWRREVHDTVGWFDPEYVSAGDYEFWMRLAKGYEFKHIDESLGIYLESESSIEHANQETAAQEVRTALERHANDLLRLGGVPEKDWGFYKRRVLGEYRAAGRIELPRCALLGTVQTIQQLAREKKYLEAWKAGLEALELRSFNPDALLVMTDVALSAGREQAASQCARWLAKLTPKWELAQKLSQTFDPNEAAPLPNEESWPALPKARDGRPKISVCLIAKNEEEFIGECLESVQPIARQIIVVDTGSDDRTIEIAQAYGAEVYHKPWEDDFSIPRNYALEFARGDWILILDCDERLPAESHQKLWEDVSRDNMLGLRLPLRNIGNQSAGVSYVPRLFRNAPGLFFIGRIHEQIHTSVIVRRAEWGMGQTTGAATLLHLGYDPNVVSSKSKIQRNLNLLEMAVEETPNEPSLLVNYGIDLVNDGRLEEGLEKYRHAVKVMKPYPDDLILPEVRERLLTVFGVHLSQAGEFEEMLELMESKLADDSGPTASMHYLRALALIRLKREAEAIPFLHQCLKTRDRETFSPPCNDILAERPDHLLAACHLVVEQFAEAEKHFKKALETTPDSPELIHDYAQLLNRCDRSEEALTLLNEKIDTGIATEKLWFLGAFISNSWPQFNKFGFEWTEAALQEHPDSQPIRRIRGELFLKRGDLKQAAGFLGDNISGLAARHQAAIILCRIAEGEPLPAGSLISDEGETSGEFLNWYRWLLKLNAEEPVQKVKKELSRWSALLPTAASTLERLTSSPSGR